MTHDKTIKIAVRKADEDEKLREPNGFVTVIKWNEVFYKTHDELCTDTNCHF